MYDDCN
jgi:hypothetical protein